jgi:pilus assembly protein CpaB
VLTIMKRKLVGVLAAIGLALVGTLVLVAYVHGAEDRALSGEKTVGVLVVSQKVDRGTKADDLEGKVELKRVPAKVRADGGVTSTRELHGLVASADLVPGEQLVKARFARPSQVGTASQPNQGGGRADTAKLLRTTVALEPHRAVGGALKPGDLVAVFATYKPDVMQYQTHLELHKVTVVALAFAPSGGAPAQKKGSQGDNKAQQAPEGKYLVTLALSAHDSETLVHAAENGTVWLAIEPMDADESGTRVVTPANAFS